VVGLQVDIE